MLRKAGLIIGKKGSTSGYTLSKNPNEITIGEILRALEGESLLIDINDDNSNDMERFVTRLFGVKLIKKLNRLF